MKIRLIIRHCHSLPDGSKAGDAFETYDMEVDHELEGKLFKSYSYVDSSIVGFEKIKED